MKSRGEPRKNAKGNEVKEIRVILSVLDFAQTVRYNDTKWEKSKSGSVLLFFLGHYDHIGTTFWPD